MEAYTVADTVAPTGQASNDEVPHTGAAAASAGHLFQGIPGAGSLPVLRKDEAVTRAVHATTTQIRQRVDALVLSDLSMPFVDKHGKASESFGSHGI